MADLLDRDVAVEQEERWMTDSGASVLLAEDRLGREDTPESEMLASLDGVPMCIILAASDALGVVV
jgi:hypothetical protein